MGMAENWSSGVKFTEDDLEVTGTYDIGLKFTLEYMKTYDGAYIKLAESDGSYIHAILPMSIVERLVDGVRSYRDPQPVEPDPDPVKLTPQQQFDALPNLAKFEFQAQGGGYYLKLNDEYVQLVSKVDDDRYNPDRFENIHHDRNLKEVQ